MVKIGIIGDIHYPYRSKEIPKYHIEWLKENKVDILIGTGDYNDKEVIELLKEIAPETYFVKGNTDFLELPREQIIEIEDLKIYIFHSDSIYPRGDLYKLYRVGKEKDVDIVIYGHTHLPFFTYLDGVYLLNPGSATGVVSGEGIIPPKSSAILEIEKGNIRVKFNLLL